MYLQNCIIAPRSHLVLVMMTTYLRKTMLSAIFARAKKASVSSWVSNTKLSHTVFVIRPPPRSILDLRKGRTDPVICHKNTRSICWWQVPVPVLLSTISRRTKPKEDTSWTSRQGQATLTRSGPAAELFEGNLSQMISRSCSRRDSDLPKRWSVSMMGSKALAAAAISC